VKSISEIRVELHRVSASISEQACALSAFESPCSPGSISWLSTKLSYSSGTNTLAVSSGRDTDLVTVYLRRDLINKLMDLIPEEDRCLLILRDFEGHSVSYLTEITGLDEDTVKQRLLRTRQTFAKS